MYYPYVKRCPRCDSTKALSEFHLNRRRRDGHQSTCKACRSELDHERYVRRRDAGIKRSREFDRGRVEWLRSLKLGRPCSDCGRVYPPEAMQWDHVPGTLKAGDVSTIRGRSKQEILDEIAKCELVCANCHVIRTFRRAGWALLETPAVYSRLASAG